MSRIISLGAWFALALGACRPPVDRSVELESFLAGGDFVRIAEVTVGGDRVRVWQETDEQGFGPFVLVARGKDEQLLDFCVGLLRSSSQPFAQSERYGVLAAATEESGDCFFIFDSRSHRFSLLALPESVSHVHEGMLIRGATLLYSTCKTPEPVWMLDMSTARFTSLGREAPQSAEFGIVGSTVIVMGPSSSHELDGARLKPTNMRAPPNVGSLNQFKTATR